MEIKINEEAVNWYRKELQLEKGDYLRFYPRYGGVGGNIPGFSIGINTSKPIDIQAESNQDGITFYVEKEDSWYFDEKNLIIDFDEQLKEPTFAYD